MCLMLYIENHLDVENSNSFLFHILLTWSGVLFVKGQVLLPMLNLDLLNLITIQIQELVAVLQDSLTISNQHPRRSSLVKTVDVS